MDVRLPDGRVIQNVPEGTTKAELMARVGKQEQGFLKSNDPEEGFVRTVFDQSLQGATFGFADEISDALGAAGVALLTDKDFDDLFTQARELSKERIRRQFQQRSGATIAANIAGGLATGGIGTSTKAGANIANSLRTGNLAARAGKSAAVGAASGAAFGAGTASGEPGSGRLEGAAKGAAVGAPLGAALPLAGAALSGGRNAIVPVIDDAIGPLARRARELDIPLRADQVKPSRVRKTVQKVSQELPLSGVETFEETQKRAFNKAVAKTIGQDADDLGPEVIKKFKAEASEKFSNSLDEFVEIDRETLSALDDITINADETLTADLAGVVRKNVDKLLGDIEGNVIAGEKLASFRSELIKKATRAQGGAREFLGDIVDFVDDVAEQSLTGEKAAQLKQARREWRNFRTIEPLLEKSTDGNINPTELLNRVKSSRFIRASASEIGDDDLVDLARIGKAFLPKQGGSDTFQKSVLGGGSAALGVTALNNPLLALGLGTKAAAGLGVNRAFQGINTSQKIIDAALKEGRKVPQLPARANPLIGLVSGGQATTR